MPGDKVFSVPIFFVCFREGLETTVIFAVAQAWLKQTYGPNGTSPDPSLYKRLVRQMWAGVILGLLICLIVGGALIGVFYAKGVDKWASTEYYWEGTLGLVATIMISLVGAPLLRVSMMQDKWAKKLHDELDHKDTSSGWVRRNFQAWFLRYFMFWIIFTTVLREGTEAIVFIAGVSFSSPASAAPLAVVTGLLAAVFVGYLMLKGFASSSFQPFLIFSTCCLYLVAAGLFSRAVWYIQAEEWNKITGGDAAETGEGAGSYDIDNSVWHVNFGNPEINGGSGWGIFNALLGWQNSATYGSVISYNLYWMTVIIGLLLSRYKEVKGYYPWVVERFVCSPYKVVRGHWKKLGSHIPFIGNGGSKVDQSDPKTRLSESASGGSSGVFETKDQDIEKGAESVREVPSRSISE